MIRGTTPTFTFNVTGFTFENCDIVVYIKQRSFLSDDVNIKKSGDDVTLTVDGENSTVSVTLTQEEALSFMEGFAEIQLRAINSSGVVFASAAMSFTVRKILNNEVLIYGE